MIPTVEFLIPAYNAGELLARAVQSALEQTVACSVLVIDDGSTDGAPSRLAPHPRLRVEVLPQNGGLVAALNHGLRISTATFIARLDADDTAFPRRIEHQLPLLLNGHTLVASGAEIRSLDGQLRELTSPPEHHETLTRVLRSGNVLVHSTITMNRARVLDIGAYDPAWYPVEDYELWLRIAVTDRICAVPQPLVSLTLSPNGISNTLATMQFAKSELLCGAASGPAEHTDPRSDALRVLSSIRHARRIARERNVSAADLLRVATERARTRIGSVVRTR